MLKVKNLTKKFTKINKSTKEKREVGVFNLSFEAHEGKVLGLVGANGAGKTTTMRVLAGLTQKNSGEISLNNTPYSKIKNLKQKVSLVSSETKTFERLTPNEILNLFGKAAEMNKTEVQNRINEIAEKLEMTEFLNETTQNFSTGMMQKTSIARALISNPDLLIFDEITSGLDIFAAKGVKEIIKDLKSEGKIIIFSTHIMPDADELCDELVMIHKGKKLLDGEKETLLKKHKVKNVNDLFFSQIKDLKDE